jgi:hypothetical protein
MNMPRQPICANNKPQASAASTSPPGDVDVRQAAIRHAFNIAFD